MGKQNSYSLHEAFVELMKTTKITNKRIKPAWAKGKCQKCGKLTRFMVVMLCDDCIASIDPLNYENAIKPGVEVVDD